MSYNKNHSNYKYKNKNRNYHTNDYKKDEVVKGENKVNEVKKIDTHKEKKHPFVNFFLFLTLLSSLAFFGITLWKGQDQVDFFPSLVSSLLLVVFSILFVAICVTNPRRKKGTIVLGSFFLLLFNIFGGVNTLNLVSIPALGQVEDFTGKSLTDVVKWASKNKVTLNQDYEYSDMISAYNIISQDVSEGTKIKDVKELTVSVSDGPNPEKEIIVPEMVGWDSERVVNYVLDNYLNNVLVEFVESEKAEDTLIEQSKSGSMKRSDELKLTFSLGEEKDNSDVKLIDLTNKSEFEATFYLKQHRIKYEIEKDFSNKIERGNVSKQSKKAGTMVKVDNDDDKVVITISKGKSIKVPDLKKMSMVEITEWVVLNKLKLEFTNQYDDSVKENDVISTNYSKGDKIEQGTTIKVVISKGQLVMEDFKSFDEFREWADKYNIIYEEKHEFNEDVPQGQVISYSYKKGDTIKNGDSVIVTISDGKECKVPNVVGMTKSKAIDALEDAGLNYNFVTQSSSKTKNTVIRQSISAGSKVSNGTTITITLSSGKATEYREENNSSSSSSSSNSSSGSSSTSKPESKPEPTPAPTCDKSQGNTLNIQAGSNGEETKKIIAQLNPNHKFSWNFVTSCPNGDTTPGSVCISLDGQWKNYCDTITVTIVK